MHSVKQRVQFFAEVSIEEELVVILGLQARLGLLKLDGARQVIVLNIVRAEERGLVFANDVAPFDVRVLELRTLDPAEKLSFVVRHELELDISEHGINQEGVHAIEPHVVCTHYSILVDLITKGF